MNIKQMNIGLVVMVIAAFSAADFAEQATSLNVSPPDYLKGKQRDIAQYHEGNVTGESFCWHAASGAENFVRAYEATGDTVWLDTAQSYFDQLVGLMMTTPDGYRGWVGPFIYEKSLWCDVHVGDAILVNPMLDFAEVVLADKVLTDKYGDAANSYIALAKRDFVEKWDSRGTWHEDGPFGMYVAWNKYMAPGKTEQWQYLSDSRDKSGLSLPTNKNMTSAMVSLRLYRITGEQKYREIAQRVFYLSKYRMQLAGDYYRWPYWEPLGQWDFEQDTGKVRLWVNTHPYRDYQAGEVADIVEAYHSGLVYDQQDIQWIINTNLEIMWNGDMENPKWRNSDKHGQWEDQGKPDASKGYPRYAGTLWSLQDFDSTIRALRENRLRSGSIDAAYFYNVTAKQPVSFERKLVDEQNITVPPVDRSVCTDVIMAGVMPTVLKQGETAFIASKGEPTNQQIKIDLYSADGMQKLASLYEGNARTDSQGIFCFKWDGSDPESNQSYSGPYMIRWTTAGGYRQYPIEIQP